MKHFTHTLQITTISDMAIPQSQMAHSQELTPDWLGEAIRP